MQEKTFRAKSLEDAEAAANEWLSAHPQIKDVKRSTSIVRAANPSHPPKAENGTWTVTLRYNE